jgi:hypothetical protein
VSLARGADEKAESRGASSSDENLHPEEQGERPSPSSSYSLFNDNPLSITLPNLAQDKAVTTESQLSSREEMIETLHQKFQKMKRDLKALQESLSDERRKREEVEREGTIEREKRERGDRLIREVRFLLIVPSASSPLFFRSSVTVVSMSRRNYVLSVKSSIAERRRIEGINWNWRSSARERGRPLRPPCLSREWILVQVSLRGEMLIRAAGEIAREASRGQMEPGESQERLRSFEVGIGEIHWSNHSKGLVCLTTRRWGSVHFPLHSMVPKILDRILRPLLTRLMRAGVRSRGRNISLRDEASSEARRKTTKRRRCGKSRREDNERRDPSQRGRRLVVLDQEKVEEGEEVGTARRTRTGAENLGQLEQLPRQEMIHFLSLHLPLMLPLWVTTGRVAVPRQQAALPEGGRCSMIDCIKCTNGSLGSKDREALSNSLILFSSQSDKSRNLWIEFFCFLPQRNLTVVLCVQFSCPFRLV